MSTRLRVMLLLVLLVGGGLTILVHLSSSLLVDQETRMRQKYYGAIVSAVAHRVDLDSSELDPTTISRRLRELLGVRIWVLWKPERANWVRVEPSADAHILGDHRKLESVLNQLPKSRLVCDLGPYGPRDTWLCGFRATTNDAEGEEPRWGVFFLAKSATGDPENYLGIISIMALVAGLLLVSVGYLMISIFLVRPLRKVVRSMERASSGPGRAYMEPTGGLEFQAIAHAFNRMSEMQRKSRDKINDQVEQLRQTHSELSTTRDTLVRSEQLAQAGVQAASVAHEVGNPLGIVAGYVELLGTSDLGEEEKAQYVDRVSNALSRIQETLRQLLDFSTHEGELLEPECQLSSVVHRVTELVRPQRRFRGVTLKTNLSEELPLAKMPAGHLEQVLLNLLLNAADAVGEGGTVDVSADLEVETQMLVLTVKDNGPGIPEDLREQVFEAFITTKPKGKGTGLGLFVCRHLVESYRGELSLKDVEDGGACFEIRLWAVEEEQV